MKNAVGCLLALLMLSAMSLGQSASNRGPVEGLPRIVARVKLTNQSGLVPPRVIFTPKTSGLFRLSMAIVITTPKTGSEPGLMGGVIGYSDVIPDSVEGAYLDTRILGSQGGGQTMTFAAKGGKAFKLSTQTGGADITGAVYDVFVVIERLTKIPSF